MYVDSGRWRAAYASVSMDGFRPVFFIWSGERTNVYHKEIQVVCYVAAIQKVLKNGENIN